LQTEPDDFIVDEIKDALRRCERVMDVNACARHYAVDVSRLQRAKDPEKRVMAIQIKNLASYKRKMLR